MTVQGIRSNSTGARQFNSQRGKRLTLLGEATAVLAIAATPFSAKAATGERLPELAHPNIATEAVRGIQPENRELKTKIDGTKLAQNVSSVITITIGGRNIEFGSTRNHNGYPVIDLPGGQTAVVFDKPTPIEVKVFIGYQDDRPLFRIGTKIYDRGVYYLVGGFVTQPVPGNVLLAQAQNSYPPQTIPQPTYQNPQQNLYPFDQAIKEKNDCAFDLFNGITKEGKSVQWLNTNYAWCFNRAQQLDPNNPYITGTGSVQSALDRSPNEILPNVRLAIPIPGTIRSLGVQEYWDGTFKGF